MIAAPRLQGRSVRVPLRGRARVTRRATTSPEFNALKRELLALIREESVRAAADTLIGPAA